MFSQQSDEWIFKQKCGSFAFSGFSIAILRDEVPTTCCHLDNNKYGKYSCDVCNICQFETESHALELGADTAEMATMVYDSWCWIASIHDAVTHIFQTLVNFVLLSESGAFVYCYIWNIRLSEASSSSCPVSFMFSICLNFRYGNKNDNNRGQRRVSFFFCFSLPNEWMLFQESRFFWSIFLLMNTNYAWKSM